MKKIISTILTLFALITVTGCNKNKQYLPDAKNDEIFTTVGIDENSNSTNEQLSDFCLISEAAVIQLNSDISTVNMEPVNIEYGSGDGFKWSTHKYTDIEIKSLLSDDKKSMINRITTSSPNYQTPRGIKVGDSIAKLTDSYKEYLTYSESTEESYYVYEPENDIGFKRIYFYVQNHAISRIVIEDGIDG